MYDFNPHVFSDLTKFGKLSLTLDIMSSSVPYFTASHGHLDLEKLRFSLYGKYLPNQKENIYPCFAKSSSNLFFTKHTIIYIGCKKSMKY